MQLSFIWDTQNYNKRNTKIYFACPTGKRRDAIVEEFTGSMGECHFGACVTPYYNNGVTIKKMPYFFDNGAYKCWKDNSEFDHELFIKKVWELEAKMQFGEALEADFIVLPDIVAGGDDSLDFSLQWAEYMEENMPHISRYNFLYLPVQNGMDIENVERVIKRRMVDGLFMGGTKDWKYSDAHKWVELAHRYDLPIHCGGIGTRKDIEWAKEVGFDSVDSGIAIIHPHHLKDVLEMERRELACKVA